MTGPKTVGDYIALLRRFPEDMPVMVSTPAGGGVAIERRDVKGQPVVAIFGANGGRFGENPLTEEEYQKQSASFVLGLKNGMSYTTVHGDHRLYTHRGDCNDTCYGHSYDERIIARMVSEGLLEYYKIPYSRDGVWPARGDNYTPGAITYITASPLNRR